MKKTILCKSGFYKNISSQQQLFLYLHKYAMNDDWKLDENKKYELTQAVYNQDFTLRREGNETVSESTLSLEDHKAIVDFIAKDLFNEIKPAFYEKILYESPIGNHTNLTKIDVC